MFKESSRQEVLDRHEEASENQFLQCTHHGENLLNKDKHECFVMQFVDTTFRHTDTIVLSFRKH